MPQPGKNETHKDWIQRCIPIVIRDKTAKDGAQARAICESIWKQKPKGLDMAKIIRLVDVIGDDAQALFDQLPTNGEDITLEIDSPGGSVDTAMAFYTKLLDVKGKVTTDVLRLAASAATIPMQAASKGLRKIRSNARIMIHNPYTGRMGDSTVFQKTADELKALEEELAELYSNSTGIAVDEMLEMMKEETTLTAEEAVDKGFADEVIPVPAKKVNIYTPKILMQMGFTKIPDEFKTPKFQIDEETIMIKEIAELLECKAEEVLDKIKELIQAATKKVEPTGDPGTIEPAVQRELDTKDAKIANLESAVATMTPQLQSFSAYRLEQDKNGRKEQLQILLKGDGEQKPKITPAQLPGAEALLDLDDGFVAFDAFRTVMQAGPDLDLASMEGSGGEGAPGKDKKPEDLAVELANAKRKEDKSLSFKAALQMVFKDKPELEVAYNNREIKG